MTTTRSAALFRRAKELMPGGVSSPVRSFASVGGEPFFVGSGRGSRVRDADGKSYIDYVQSYGPHLFGHAPPFVRRALSGALRRGTSFGAPTALEVRLAERVVAAVPSVEMVRFVSSGTEATMSAVRLARAATGRGGAILIFDEVISGFRVAAGGAQQLYGLSPDLTTLGKILGGGLPVGAYGGRRDLMEKMAPAGSVYQAGTLSGNPLAMTAG